MVKHPWPLLEISLSDFHRLATLNINTYLPTYLLTPLEGPLWNQGCTDLLMLSLPFYLRVFLI